MPFVRIRTVGHVPASGTRKRLLLFSLAIVLPSVVFLGLGARLLRQERELADKRRADERTRIIGTVRHELAARLERLRLQASANSLNPSDATIRADPLALVADGDGDRSATQPS